MWTFAGGGSEQHIMYISSGRGVCWGLEPISTSYVREATKQNESQFFKITLSSLYAFPSGCFSKGGAESKASQAFYKDRKCANSCHHCWTTHLAVIATFLVHTRYRYARRRREHLVTIRDIGLDGITVSTHLLQQTIYCQRSYITQRPLLCPYGSPGACLQMTPWSHVSHRG